MKGGFVIHGDAHPVSFGYGATRIMGEKWGCAGVLEVFQRAIGIMGLEVQSKNVDVDSLDSALIAQSLLSFENLETLADIIMAGAVHAAKAEKKEVPVWPIDEVATAIMEDLATAVEIYMAFLATMPRPKENSVVPKKKTATKRRK